MPAFESNARIIENPLFIDVPIVTRKTKQLYLQSLTTGEPIELATFPVFCESADEVKDCLVFEIELDDLSPLYAASTKILVKMIYDWESVSNGVYAVNYKGKFLTIKRVRGNDLSENATITLYANPHERGESSITLNKEEINYIWKAEKIVSAPLPG